MQQVHKDKYFQLNRFVIIKKVDKRLKLLVKFMTMKLIPKFQNLFWEADAIIVQFLFLHN